MANYRWEIVCSCCGARGNQSQILPEGASSPGITPSSASISGRCPFSPDGKHKPKWENVGRM